MSSFAPAPNKFTTIKIIDDVTVTSCTCHPRNKLVGTGTPFRRISISESEACNPPTTSESHVHIGGTEFCAFERQIVTVPASTFYINDYVPTRAILKGKSKS